MSWPPFSPGTAATRVGCAWPWPCTDVSRLPTTNTTARATAAVTMNDARLRILISSNLPAPGIQRTRENTRRRDTRSSRRADIGGSMIDDLFIDHRFVNLPRRRRRRRRGFERHFLHAPIAELADIELVLAAAVDGIHRPEFLQHLPRPPELADDPAVERHLEDLAVVIEVV